MSVTERMGKCIDSGDRWVNIKAMGQIIYRKRFVPFIFVCVCMLISIILYLDFPLSQLVTELAAVAIYSGTGPPAPAREMF